MEKKQKEFFPSANGGRERKTHRNWFVGTSGYMVSKKVWYAQKELNCIEINQTFYRTPQEATWLKWKKEADTHNITIVVKVTKFITHMKKLKDCKEVWAAFWDRAQLLGDRLGGLLFQFPPSFKQTEVNMARLEDVASYLPRQRHGPILVFEFRDESWYVPPVFKLFQKERWCLAGTVIRRPPPVNPALPQQRKTGTEKPLPVHRSGFPERQTGKQDGGIRGARHPSGWMGTMPSGIFIPPRTGPATYVRVHGGKGFRGFYSPAAVAEVISKMTAQRTTKNFLFFNNVFFDMRGDGCELGGKKVTMAAVCDGVIAGQQLQIAR